MWELILGLLGAFLVLGGIIAFLVWIIRGEARRLGADKRELAQAKQAKKLQKKADKTNREQVSDEKAWLKRALARYRARAHRL